MTTAQLLTVIALRDDFIVADRQASPADSVVICRWVARVDAAAIAARLADLSDRLSLIVLRRMTR